MQNVESPAALALLTGRGRWKLTNHLQLLNEALVYLEGRQAPVWWLRERMHYDVEGEPEDLIPFTRLIVEMPPRHGKSEMVSRYFPAWYLGRHPSERVILCSYEANFAAVWGGRVRDLLKEWGQALFGIGIKRDHQARFDWEIDSHDGGMVTAGVGGPITGRGANLGIIDDAIKNAEEAASPTIQKRNADWFDSTFYTRLEPDSICVDMGTRWHAADLTGHILSLQEQEEEDDEGDQDADDEFWFRLRLPALAEPDDVLGRAEGEALWPERFPASRLLRMARRIGAYFFGALYQQRPSSAEGQIFKRGWWQYYGPADLPEEARDPIWGGIFADTAGWDDQSVSTDYAAISVVVRVGLDLWWLHAARGRWTFPQFQQRLRDLRDEFHLPIVIEQTPWANPLIQSMAAELTGVLPFKIEGHSKVTRAMAASPYAAGGNFHLPRGAAWVSDFVSEHADFPTGSHDDWVDTTSMAALRLLVGVGQIDYTPPRTRRLTYQAPPDTRQPRRPGTLPPPPGASPGGRSIGGRA